MMAGGKRSPPPLPGGPPLLLLLLALSLLAAAPRAAAAAPPTSANRVHAFFYLWYGNPGTDGRYLHWNHEVLPHWNPSIAKGFPSGERFNPPEELHSPYYPERGPYSASDPATLRSHMEELAGAGVGVLVLSWWGPAHREGTADTQGVQTDHVLPVVMRTAEEAGALVAFHLEPYPGRSADSVREDLAYLMERYGESKALYRVEGRPVYYVYDSYHIPSSEWARLLTPGGSSSVRGTSIDGFFIGLWLGRGSGHDLAAGGFDGFYTYFASSEVSYGADPRNWPSMASFAKEHGMAFVASVGPGYDDTRIRPWNSAATRDREGGRRYERVWKSAIDSRATFVSITSYNEWGEGTQIEPAVAKALPVCIPLPEIFLRYTPNQPERARGSREPASKPLSIGGLG
mmetsp:Transcript_24147/g.75781  ORF Transcript_24147/g.75781 Transcript_24147/m.75781 type:complete len:401 (+) Transcript_24147:1161-2363(+)